MNLFKLIILIFFLISANSLFSQQIKTPSVKKEEPTLKKTTPTAPNAGKLTLKVNPNMRCSLKIDGEDKGIIEKDAIKKIFLSKGEYKIVATSSENVLDAFETKYIVAKEDINSEKLFEIDLLKASNTRITKEQTEVKVKTEAEKHGTITDARDGKTYKTVKIGTQIWMAENLNYNASSGSWCYDNDNNNCNKYGRLYDWETAKKVCTDGWHLPGDAEWSALINYVGSDEGKKLKSTSGWNSSGNGSDTYGFTALSGGFRSNDATFGNIGDHGYCWSATEYSTTSAYGRDMYCGNSNMNRYNYDKAYGFSVRCIRDF